MKKFGFGKKSGDDGGDDAGRSALFGRKNKSPAPGSDNPYAQAPAGNDPYAQDTNKYANMTPYQAARAGAPGPAAATGLPSGPRAGGYGAPPQPAGGYGNEKYGAAGGYGANRYDDNKNAYAANNYTSGVAGGARGPGGYGGLGRTDSNGTDAQRDELFGGAQDRYQQKQQQQPASGYGGYGAGGSGADSGYSGYGEQRELTAEEQEAEEYRATKNQIKDVRNESVNTVNRALAIAAQAEETGRGTLARLGAQGERLHNTEKNLDLAANHNKVAEERAKELKTLNRSMWAVHVSNPFTSKSRAEAADQAILDRHRQERETREATRNAAFQSNQRMEDAFRDMSLSGRPQAKSGGLRSQAERSRFVLEDDDDDDAAEAERQERLIEDGLDQIGGALGRMNMIAKAQANEVEQQMLQIDRTAKKSDAVSDGTVMNRARLDRIK